MNFMMAKCLPALSSIAVLSAVMAMPAAQAQNFPTRTASLVVPFAPGGATDVLSRMLAPAMEKNLGQSVIVENKPGADSRIGARYVASSAPDGYNVVILSGSSVSWPFFIKDPGVDMIKDFAPIGVIVDGALIFVASNKSPFSSIKEMVEYAKKNPGKVTWGLPSRSGEPALYGYLLRAKTGIQMLDVVYKGSGPLTTAVIASEVDVGHFAPGRAVQMEKGGEGKMLAASGDKRDVLMPNVPTMKELGYDGMVNYNFGMLAPAGTPAAVVNRWNAAMLAALKDPIVVSGNAKFGFNAIGSSPAQHAASLKSGYEAWKLATETAHVQPE